MTHNEPVEDMEQSPELKRAASTMYASQFSNAMQPIPFDYVIVFKIGSKKKNVHFARQMYAELLKDGFFSCFRVRQERIYIAVGASDRLLYNFLKSKGLSEETSLCSSRGGLERVYAQSVRQRIFSTYFDIRKYGGKNATLDILKDSGIVLDYFPLHDPYKSRYLWEKTKDYYFVPSEGYLEDVEEYFGEEVAMYLSWLRHVAIWACPVAALSIVGGILQIVQDFNSWSMTAFGLMIPIWAQLLHESWKRNEKKLAHRFGTLGMSETAKVRKGFTGVDRELRWFFKGTDTDMNGDTHVEYNVGNFELPIQHSIPLSTETEVEDVDEQDPFSITEEGGEMFEGLPARVVEKHYPSWKRTLVYLISFPTTLAFCVSVVITIYLVEWLRNYFADPETGRLGEEYSILCAVINGAVLVGLNQIYPSISWFLTNLENHRTQAEHENSYIIKLFFFLFVNSYFPIYLTAFRLYIVVQSDNLEKAGSSGRTIEVFAQLLTAFIATVVVGNVRDVALPFFFGKLGEVSAGESNQQTGSPMSSPREEGLDSPGTAIELEASNAKKLFERQFLLAGFAPVLTRFQERIILFGFATLFAAVFPFGVVFVFLDAMLVMRVEIARFLKLMRREIAKPVDSIGSWSQCIQLLIVAAGMSNALLICFTTDTLQKYFNLDGHFQHRINSFVVMEHIMVMFVFTVEYIIPDTSMSILRLQALAHYRTAQRTNRLTFDALSKTFASVKVEDTEYFKNDYNICVQCNAALTVKDIVKRMHCLHPVHDSCLESFLKAHACAGDDGAEGEFVACPKCDRKYGVEMFHMDTRKALKSRRKNLREYFPHKHTVVGDIEEQCVRRIEAEHLVLRSRAEADYDFCSQDFPTNTAGSDEC